MNDTSPAKSKPQGPIPADDPGRVLTHVSPDTDESLPHLGMVGDTYTILVSGADTAGRYTLIDMHVPPGGGPPPHHRQGDRTRPEVPDRAAARRAEALIRETDRRQP
jgi:hypothetical protein